MYRSSENWWLAIGLIIALLVGAQFWVAFTIKQRTSELGSVLTESYSQALQLTRALGYGGLIHNFKNHVLRPDEPQYLERVKRDAEKALGLVAKVEANAAAMGLDSVLSRTRSMIQDYEQLAESASELSARGLRPVDVDEQVRVEDVHALREIDTTLQGLARTITARVETLNAQDRIFRALSALASLAMGCLVVVALLIQRFNRAKLAEQMSALNQKLTVTNESLSDANTSLQQFAGIVSHDLKTPLRHISFIGEMIEDDIDDQRKVKSHIEKIWDSVKSMDCMIASLLDFTQTGFTEPTLAQVALRSIVDSVVDELEPAIEATSATIDVNADVEVVADAELLRRVLHNLIGNSLKYCRQGVAPEIAIDTLRDGDKVIVSVRDNGIGINPEYAERIFEPLTRLHSAKSEYEGVGIGLSLARSVIASHAGSIWLDTDHREGACIKFSLTVAESAEQSIAA